MLTSGDIREVLRTCLDKYDRAYHLQHEDSKRDPENEPYRSLYAAKDLLSQIKVELAKLYDTLNTCPASTTTTTTTTTDDVKVTTDDVKVTVDDLTVITAAINYHLGVIGVDTEELSVGEEHLMTCLHSLGNESDSSVLTQDRILAALQTLNQLGVLASLRGNAEQSEKYLKQAETLCGLYRFQVGLPPHSLRDLLAKHVDRAEGDDQSEANWKLLEKALTHTFYYLAQVHNSLGKTASAAVYCHTTLRRQLESREYEPVEWAVNAATLSQHFVMHNDFRTARHHLACAEHILADHATKMAVSHESSPSVKDEEIEGSSREELIERLRGRRADVSRCWAKYGLLLLSVSWDERMRRSVGGVSDGLGDLQLEDSAGGGARAASVADGGKDVGVKETDEAEEASEMWFVLPEAKVIEEQVTYERVSDFERARPVFLNAQKWLQCAKEYYTMEDHASDHVEIVQDASKLYKLLSYFEPCADRRCKMHKRRVDLLEAALARISPTYYLNACRQMQFELGETYSEMLDLKWTLYRDAPPVNSAARKVNHLAEQSIKFFQAFIDTFLDTHGKIPEQYPEELLRPALLANFCVGRLHAKLVTSDTLTQVANLRAALERYEYVRQYCERFPAAIEVFREEWEVSREMSRLLPVKMDKLLQLHSRNAAAAN